jgi:hypothetical protein
MDRRRLTNSQDYPEMARGISYAMAASPRFHTANRHVQTLSSTVQPQYEQQDTHAYRPKVKIDYVHDMLFG